EAEEYAGLLEWMREQLDEDIKEVRLSSRLTVSPACVVADANDLTPALENMYRAMGQEVPRAKRILELNAGHVLVKGLNEAYREREGRSGLVETTELRYYLAVIAEGGRPQDPAPPARLVADRQERDLKSLSVRSPRASRSGHAAPAGLFSRRPARTPVAGPGRAAGAAAVRRGRPAAGPSRRPRRVR